LKRKENKLSPLSLILIAPDLDKKMRIEVDTSDYAMGGVINGMQG